jgi:hypothetical protein
MGDWADDIAHASCLIPDADDEGYLCPKCGSTPALTHTQFGWRRDCCGLWGWGKHAPIVDAETHQARQYAHRVFDSLWQSGLVGRSRAYALLAQELGLTPEQCHMKIMDKATARRVPTAAHEIGKRLKGRT